MNESGTRRLDGRVAFITGAASGLGRAITRRFAAEGAAVAGVDRDLRALDALVAEVRAAGGSAIAIAADVTSSSELARAAEHTANEFGGIGVAVANAGIAANGSATDSDEQDWERVIAINLSGVWRTAKAVLPYLVADGDGSLITQASVAGLIGIPGLAAYSAAKGGVIALSRQMAIEYAPDNVRVNAIAPATVPTPLTANSRGLDMDDPIMVAARETARLRHPLGRLGTTSDIASAAAFLASNESSWITGTVLVVDGGRTAQ